MARLARRRFAFPRRADVSDPSERLEPGRIGDRLLRLLRERGQLGVGREDIATLRLRGWDQLAGGIGNLRRHGVAIARVAGRRWALADAKKEDPKCSV